MNSNCGKSNNSLNDSKCRKKRLALSCSKKTITFTKRNNQPQKIMVIFLGVKLSSFFQNRKYKSHEKVCKNKDFSSIVLPTPKNYILKFNQCMKYEIR